MIEKLIKIQSELKAPKGQYNSFGKYKYRSCEDILEAVKPLVSREGLLLTLSDVIEQIGNRFYVKATIKLTDGTQTIENTAYAREEDSKKGMDGSQITGTASSYARKYALNGLFCIDDTKDADTDENHIETTARGRQREQTKTMPEKQKESSDDIKNEQKKKILIDLAHASKGDGLTGKDIALIIAYKFGKESSNELTLNECAELKSNYMKYWQELQASQKNQDDEKLTEGMSA